MLQAHGSLEHLPPCADVDVMGAGGGAGGSPSRNCSAPARLAAARAPPPACMRTPGRVRMHQRQAL